MIRTRVFALVLSVCLSGCGGSTPPPGGAQSQPKGEPTAEQGGQLRSPTARELLHELDTWEAQVEIAQRTDPGVGLGDSVVRVEGEPVWPPAGEQCLGLVRCCEQLAGKDAVFGLLCQLSIAKDGSCDRGLKKVATIVVEAEMQLPEACVESL